MSINDYKNEKDISFLVKFNDIASNIINENSLYFVLPGNKLYNNTIREYKNLFSFKSLGEKLIIDSSDKRVLNEIDFQLKDLGYKKINSPKPSFFEILIKYGEQEPRASFVFFLSILIYLFYIIGLVNYIFSEKEFMYLYWTSNPNKEYFIKNFFKHIILKLFISVLICYFFYNIIGYSFGISNFAFFYLLY